MRVRVITPVVTRSLSPSMMEALQGAARADDRLEIVFLDSGPASVECEFDGALSVPGIIAKAIEGERTGANAIVTNGIADLGLKAARERVSIPVVGPMEMAARLAVTLGRKFSLLTVVDRFVPMLKNLVIAYGLADRLASIRPVGIPVLDLDKDRARMIKTLAEQGRRAVEEDGADVLVLGCTGMAGAAKAVEKDLTEGGYQVPVIDPPLLAVKVAEVLVDLGLGHSKRTYRYPSRKLVAGYEGLGIF